MKNNKSKRTLVKLLGALLLLSAVISGAIGCTDTPDTDTSKITVNSNNPDESTGVTGSYVSTESTPVESTPIVTTGKTLESSETTPTTSTPDSSGTTPVTSAPESSEITPTTSTPETSEDEPVIDNPIIDIPGDEDGYTYPEFFADLIHKDIVLNDAIKDAVEDHHEVSTDLPEIVFVGVGQMTLELSNPIEIYARFALNNGEELYARFVYTIKYADYRNVVSSKKHNSYDSYVEAVVTALENQDTLFSATYSEENDLTMTEEESRALAPIIDEKFVDVDVFYSEVVKDPTYTYVRQINGFAYDEEGNSYSFFTVWRDLSGRGSWNSILEGAVSGELKSSDFKYKETTSKRIDSVFVSESQIENE